MKIERSEKVQTQLQQASALRTKRIDHFTNALDYGVENIRSKNNPPRNPFIQTLEFPPRHQGAFGLQRYSAVGRMNEATSSLTRAELSAVLDGQPKSQL